jgi:hypothetical protein
MTGSVAILIMTKKTYLLYLSIYGMFKIKCSICDENLLIGNKFVSMRNRGVINTHRFICLKCAREKNII